MITLPKGFKYPKYTDDNFITKSEYMKRVKTLCDVDQVVKPLRVYALHYKFNTDVKDFKTISAWDWFPLVYILEIRPNYFRGLNLHHVPVEFREKWLYSMIAKKKAPNDAEIVRNFIEEDTSDKLKRRKIVTIERYNKWIDYTLRTYRHDRTLEIREVTLENLKELLPLYSNTYFSMRPQGVVKKFIHEAVNNTL